ncbi:MAG: hypothetical protein K0R01_6 [Mycobacterium sp.]|nr:hypothetical protein [Mycobacterium sp.]
MAPLGREFCTAPCTTSPGWVLAVVTRALAGGASLRIYDPADVTRLPEPTHYAVDLTNVG